MRDWKVLLGVMRLPFVILAPACTLVGLGTAYWTTGQLNWVMFVVVMIGTLAAHISVNTFNEYSDFRTGLDSRTKRTPFSGGSGTLQAHPKLAPAALAIALASMLVSAAVGIYVAALRGLGILPLGIIGLFLLYGYTAWLVYHPVLCLLAPGLGFGPVIVIGTHYALTGQYSWEAAVASLVPFFLVSDLLLLNQFPDVEADQQVGRRHFPILIGRRRSAGIYTAFLVAAYGIIVLGVVYGLLPPFSALGLLTSFLAVQAIRVTGKNAENTAALMPALGQNVLISILTPILLAIGAFIG